MRPGPAAVTVKATVASNGPRAAAGFWMVVGWVASTAPLASVILMTRFCSKVGSAWPDTRTLEEIAPPLPGLRMRMASGTCGWPGTTVGLIAGWSVGWLTGVFTGATVAWSVGAASVGAGRV